MSQPRDDSTQPAAALHAELRRRLRTVGYEPGEVLGAGVEGTVFDVGDNLVAKVWHRRGADEIGLLKTFYDAVAAAEPTVSTPRLRSVVPLDDHVVSIEDRLPGAPMGAGFGMRQLTDDAIVTITECLVHLAGIRASPEMAVLPPLEGEPPFEPARQPFQLSLARLVERRSQEYLPVMASRVRDIARVVDATIGRLERLPPGHESVIHGDLFPPNILLDDDGRTPSAILDFGFLSTVGDPAFDAAVSASIFDMYGEHGRQVEATLDRAIAERLRYPIETLGLYRAAYALATSNVFSPDGRDGHFEWCMRMLERADVRMAIDLS